MSYKSNLYNKAVFIFLFIALLVLSSCASQQKTGSISPLTDPFIDKTFNIVSIDVASDDPAAHNLAEQLQSALASSIGVPDTAFTKRAKLYVKILPAPSLNKPGKELADHIVSFGTMRIDVSVRAADIITDATLKSAEFNASSTSNDPRIASIVIEEKLVAQIRHFLGLTLVPPMMVSKSVDKMIDRSDVVTMPAHQPKQNFVNLQMQTPTVLIPLMKANEPLLDDKSRMSIEELIKKVEKNDIAMNAMALETKKRVEKEITSPDIKKAAPSLQSKTEVQSSSIETVLSVTNSGEGDDRSACVVTAQNNCLTILGK